MFNPQPKPEKKNKQAKNLVCKCGSKLVVNRTHSLCFECNQVRLYGKDWKKGKIKASKQFLSKIMSNHKNKKKVSQKPLKQVSDTNKYTCSDGTRLTQSQIDSRYLSTCKMIDLIREPVCESCGRGDKPLSHSHIISRARCKQLGKSELIYDESNIVLECFESPTSNPTCCHNKHELGVKYMFESLIFDQKLAYIKEYDKETYQKFLFDLKDL